MADTTDGSVGEKGQHFNLLMNAAGDVMVAFDATPSKPHNPLFVYDGRVHGILYKDKKNPVPFYPIAAEAKEAMTKAKNILCVEVFNHEVVAQYNAKLEVRKNGTA